MFVFEFERALFRLRAKTPAFAPLFQLPHGSADAQATLPAPLSCKLLNQPPIMRPISSR